jgi:hypothetical protein
MLGRLGAFFDQILEHFGTKVCTKSFFIQKVQEKQINIQASFTS